MDAGRGTRYVRKHPEPSAGDRFGELTVVGFRRGSGGGIRAVLVQCSCGNDVAVLEANLRSGKTTRCNRCAKQKATDTRKHYWGYVDIVPDDAHRRRLLNRIAACINRCRNPNDEAYPNYGGRGIRVWSEWESERRGFLAYLVTLDGWDEPRLELDRIDVDKGYEPGNLRFVTKQANTNNRRSMQQLQARIAELEARLRHCTCGCPEPVHDPDAERLAACS